MWVRSSVESTQTIDLDLLISLILVMTVDVPSITNVILDPIFRSMLNAFRIVEGCLNLSNGENSSVLTLAVHSGPDRISIFWVVEIKKCVSHLSQSNYANLS
jgi:hypothetical protein